MAKVGGGMWAMLAVAAAGLGAGVVYAIRRPRPDPAREMMGSALPAWQNARFRRGSVAAGDEAGALLARARPWPEVAAAFAKLDWAWPDYDRVRAAVGTVNQALAGARLPYFVDVQRVNDRPITLSYDLLSRVPWRIGARTVDVLWLRRLDTLNVELAFHGITDDKGLPVVLVDRIEATLAVELPAMYGHKSRRTPPLNDFDRAALARDRALLEAKLGRAEMAAAVAALVERDELLDDVRASFHRRDMELHPPDGLALGDRWLQGLEPYTRHGRHGPVVMLESDLRKLARADERLRSGATARTLGAVVDWVSLTTEAHEARHALDEVDPVGPPPPALFEVMEESTTPFIRMADGELRAYLGELHDTAAPACFALAKLLRNAFGTGASLTPHYYATLTILQQLDPDPAREPAARLALLCDLPDAELRRRVGAAWEKLYGAPLVAGARSPSP